MYGCEKSENLKAEVRGLVEWIQGREEENEVSFMTAREIMEGLTAQEKGEELTMPKMGKGRGAAPEKASMHTAMAASNTQRATSGKWEVPECGGQVEARKA